MRECLEKNIFELRKLIVRQSAEIIGERGLACDRSCLFSKFAQRYKNAAEVGCSTAREKIGELGSPGLLLDSVGFCKIALKRCVRCERAIDSVGTRNTRQLRHLYYAVLQRQSQEPWSIDLIRMSMVVLKIHQSVLGRMRA